MVLAMPGGVGLVNRLHGKLPLAQKQRLFFACGGRSFRVEGTWSVEFAGRTLTLPLHRDFAPAWPLALAFHGHDTELHQFYEWLIRSAPPRVVFDVGASYGLHSLRFLAHGVYTVSFEPNPACHAYLRECGVLNGLRPEIHGAAVADDSGSAELAAPMNETYLGTIMRDVKDRWGGRSDVTTMTVPKLSLDDFVATSALVPDLVKIDAEGSALAVLRGARHLLATSQPLVVFESWRASGDRPSLFDSLTSCGYAIRPLMYPYSQTPSLSLADFGDASATNFVAEPASRPKI
jgi:FkbM family methyltransferase